MEKYWVVPPEWYGETAFILAGGPSLRGFDASVLRGRARIIVINTSFRLAPWADVLYFCDAGWWRSCGYEVMERFLGRYIVTLENRIEGVKRLRNTGLTGLETDPCGLRTGNNSGYQAINLAYHFGVKRIVLLGYDMRVAPNATHWFGSYPGQPPECFQRTLTEDMLPHFQTLVEPLNKAGVEVINSTPGSALRCWPYVPLREVLDGFSCRR